MRAQERWNASKDTPGVSSIFSYRPAHAAVPRGKRLHESFRQGHRGRQQFVAPFRHSFQNGLDAGGALSSPFNQTNEKVGIEKNPAHSPPSRSLRTYSSGSSPFHISLPAPTRSTHGIGPADPRGPERSSPFSTDRRRLPEAITASGGRRSHKAWRSVPDWEDDGRHIATTHALEHRPEFPEKVLPRHSIDDLSDREVFTFRVFPVEESGRHKDLVGNLNFRPKKVRHHF